MSAIGTGGKRTGIAPAWRARLLALCMLLIMTGLLRAQEDERAVRAAFVFNLTKYVSWPERRNDRLIVCVTGQGGMGQVLKQVLENKVSEGRHITVFLHPSEIELRDCDVLYVEELSQEKIRAALDRTHSRAVLTVGDSDQFTRVGGMVALVRSGDQIEIHVNLDSLRSRQLEMSSRLLNLAVIVSRNGGMR